MIIVIDCGTNRIPEISNIVSNDGHQYKVIPRESLDTQNLCDTGISGVIISGGPDIIDESNREIYTKRFSFLDNIQVPVLGICFGHQVIGHFFGCTFENKTSFRGKRHISLLQDHFLFHGVGKYIFHENHQQHISVSPGFQHIASSNDCKNEAMVHTNRPIYSLQFHPEVSGESGKKIMQNFLDTCKYNS